MASNDPRVVVMGVPSSAGAHWPGQEKAPAALREAGLVPALLRAGLRVHDEGDGPLVRSRPERGCPQNLAPTVATAVDVSRRVRSVLGASDWPFVVGGDCTITVGAVAGALAVDDRMGLLYFDGGPDLRTPADQPECCLDAMGLAHLLDLPGVVDELAGLAPRRPALTAESVVFFGGSFDEQEARAAQAVGLATFDLATVAADPGGSAEQACGRLAESCSGFLVHFDVDVVDFVDLALADYPQINRGLTLAQAMTALQVIVSHPSCRGLVVTEVNPDHGDLHGEDLSRLIDGLVGALSAPAR